MNVAFYPRAGQVIAPATLREVLDVPLPEDWVRRSRGRFRRLCDVDETAWRILDARACRRIAERIYNRLVNHYESLPEVVLGRRLPVPDGLELGDITLGWRPWGKLKAQFLSGRLRRLADLRHWTVGDIVALRDMGSAGLLDLLSALETASRRPAVMLPAATLEEELRRVIGCVCLQPDVDIVARMWGWDGGGGCQVRHIPPEIGLSPPAVGHVLRSAQHLLQRHRSTFRTPILNRALRELGSQLPALPAQLERHLHRQGLSAKPFRLEGIVHAASLLGRDLPFAESWDTVRSQLPVAMGPSAWVSGRHVQRPDRIVLPKQKHGRALLRRVVRFIDAVIWRWGVCDVVTVVSRFRQELGEERAAAMVTLLVPRMPGLSWLDESGGWFWRRFANRNTVLTYARKALAVTGPLEVAQLREGLLRVPRLQPFLPPDRVLRELCRQAGMRIVGDRVIPGKLPDSVLAPTERILRDVIRNHGPLLSSVAFREECQARGMKRRTAQQLFSKVPFLDFHPPGLWSVRGFRADQVSRVVVRQPRPRLLQEYGWTADGRAWFRVQLTRKAIQEGQVHVPKPLHRYFEGRHFVLQGARYVASMLTRQGVVTGVGAWFRTIQKAQVGDVLLLVWDPRRKVIRARWLSRRRKA
jgi:hypothetical protein